MGALGLELRDLEILRALLRLRYLPTRQIVGAFFACPRDGRRRIQLLSGRDLIRPHTKGIEEQLGYSVWRLTRAGLDAVLAEFPDEPVGDGFLERAAEGRLFALYHREAIADLYLRVVAQEPPRASKDVSGRTACRKWMSQVRQRASHISWQGDGEVCLAYEYLGQRHALWPDATVACAAEKMRIFIEMDRSTKTLKRIEQTFKRYAEYFDGPYRQRFGNELDPILLFVVPSEARRANLKKVASGMLKKPRALSIKERRHAGPALATALFKHLGNEAPVPARSPTATLADELRGFAGQLLGEITKLELDDYFSPSFLQRGRALLDEFGKVAGRG
jgi:hypothetical protein